jgi:uncharacterized membrane protein
MSSSPIAKAVLRVTSQTDGEVTCVVLIIETECLHPGGFPFTSGRFEVLKFMPNVLL